MHRPAQAPALLRWASPTLVAHAGNPPQLLLRGDNATNQRQSLPRPREEPGKKKMTRHPQANVVFHFLGTAQAMQTQGRSLATSQTRGAPHLREVSHLYPQSHTSSMAPCAPASLPPQGLSQLLLAFTQPAFKESYAQSRTLLKPTLLVLPTGATAPWSSTHRDTPAPTPTSQRGLQVHKTSSYTHHREQPSTYLVQMAGKASRGVLPRKTKRGGAGNRVHQHSKEWARTTAHPRDGAGDPHPTAELRKGLTVPGLSWNGLRARVWGGPRWCQLGPLRPVGPPAEGELYQPSAPCGVWGLFSLRRHGGPVPSMVIPTAASAAARSRGQWAEGSKLLQMVPPVSGQDLGRAGVKCGVSFSLKKTSNW